MKKNKLAILASGSGSNAENIIRYFQAHPDVEVKLVGSNRKNAFVIERVAPFGIKTFVFNATQLMDGSVTDQLKAAEITHVILAGFMALIPPNLIEAYPDRIVNIHPSLLPQFGGKGMYGMKVPEAVIAAGAKEAGITIHLVNEKYDEGKIIFQEAIPVLSTDDATSLMERIHQLEYKNYPRVIESWVLSAGSQ